jgi:hypothetical protein
VEDVVTELRSMKTKASAFPNLRAGCRWCEIDTRGARHDRYAANAHIQYISSHRSSRVRRIGRAHSSSSESIALSVPEMRVSSFPPIQGVRAAAVVEIARSVVGTA